MNLADHVRVEGSDFVASAAEPSLANRIAVAISISPGETSGWLLPIQRRKMARGGSKRHQVGGCQRGEYPPSTPSRNRWELFALYRYY